MPLPSVLENRLALPVIGAPMLVPCRPPLTIAQCTSGIVGAFPALSARPKEELEPWIIHIKKTLADFQAANPSRKVAPFAVNQMAHNTNERLWHDMEICVKHQVPIVITSLGAKSEIVKAVHSYGGVVFHDAMTPRHAEKALEQGVDGLILLCAGGGGYSGFISPFAFVPEIRRFWSGFIAVSGAITSGGGVAAVQALGADLAYIGTRFLATTESNVQEEWKQMVVGCSSADILYTPNVNGIPGSYMRPAIVAAGLDPDNLEPVAKSAYKIATKSRNKIWTSGQGAGNIVDIPSAKTVIERLKAEYDVAIRQMAGISRATRPIPTAHAAARA